MNTNPKISNVLESYNKIPLEGDLIRFKDFPSVFPYGAGTHIQSINKYKYYYLLICDRHELGKNEFEIGVVKDGKYIKTIHCDYDNFNHPGGAQIIGDYLVVTTEDHSASSYNDTKIILYKLNINSSGSLSIDHFKQIYRNPKISSLAVGATNYIDAKGCVCHLFANLQTNDNNFLFLKFKDNMSVFDEPADCLAKNTCINQNAGEAVQCFNLFTDSGNNLYIMSFVFKSSDSSYEDIIKIHKIKETFAADGSSVFSIDGQVGDSKHVSTKHPYTTSDGVHFRWGASMNIVNDQFEVYVSERAKLSNYSYLDINVFKV